MAFYKRVHTPNSPLMPLSPMIPVLSPSMFLSPYTTSIRSRRSFTPSHLNNLPPPSLSPIQAGLKSNKKNPYKRYEPKSPEHQSKRSLDMSSTKKSMKKVRSSARKEARCSHKYVPLEPIRRTLFANDSPPIVQISSPHGSKYERPLTPNSKFRLNVTPKRILTPTNARFSFADQGYSTHLGVENMATPSILEEKFTVISILKEMNMQKYINLFIKEEIDLYVFFNLNYQDMIELGIEEADRPILLNAIDFFTEFDDPDKYML